MSGHTPGPWDLVQEKGFFSSPSWVIEARPPAEKSIALIMSTEANARLIAAAPELLEAASVFLQKLNECAGEALAVPGARRALEAAIAKAEGRS